MLKSENCTHVVRAILTVAIVISIREVHVVRAAATVLRGRPIPTCAKCGVAICFQFRVYFRFQTVYEL